MLIWSVLWSATSAQVGKPQPLVIYNRLARERAGRSPDDLLRVALERTGLSKAAPRNTLRPRSRSTGGKSACLPQGGNAPALGARSKPPLGPQDEAASRMRSIAAAKTGRYS